MTILITGCAGFIGFHVAKLLIDQGTTVIGIDNLNDYYDVNLKNSRLEILNQNKNFLFYPFDIASRTDIDELTKTHPEIEYVIHLAAQPGVRYSLINPYAYLHSNLAGQLVMLEFCRNAKNLKHFVYASSSSVYGGNKKVPFSEEDNVDHPVSLYAATKKADELMTYTYSSLYNIPSTGLRFFTVYGPYGRPDMAPHIFTKLLFEDKPIDVFNNGNLKRDFTFIDDIRDAIAVIYTKPPKNGHEVYNLGNNNSEELMHFIKVLENATGKKAQMNFKPMQPGDVKETYADITKAKRDFGFTPKTKLEEGLPKFVAWYKNYYQVK